MKKFTGIVTILLVVLLGACGTQSTDESPNGTNDAKQPEFGDIIADI